MASTVLFVAKFLLIAYILEALIRFYVPEAWVRSTLGGHSLWSVFAATAVGIPLYTTNAQALGLVGGMLSKGMGGGAALAFLIGGATTTLPAMSAVYGIAKRCVFLVYLSASVIGSLISGLVWTLAEAVIQGS